MSMLRAIQGGCAGPRSARAAQSPSWGSCVVEWELIGYPVLVCVMLGEASARVKVLEYLWGTDSQAAGTTTRTTAVNTAAIA